MIVKKYRFLLLITVLFSAPVTAQPLSETDRATINRLAKEALLLYAIAHNIAPENHVKNITNQFFGKTNVALTILTKKIMRHVCKHLYLQGLPRLSLYAQALKKFHKYQRPAPIKKIQIQKETPDKNRLSNITSFLKNNFSQILMILCGLTVCMAFFHHYNELLARIENLEEQQRRLSIKQKISSIFGIFSSSGPEEESSDKGSGSSGNDE